MQLDLDIEDARWQALDLHGLAHRAFAETLVHRDLAPRPCEISVLACDDTHIAALNADFRGKPVPTNVLSWPAAELGAARDGDEPIPPEADFTGTVSLGDIAIAYDTCAREAAEASKPMADHVTHLLVHGLLHLLGYDHERDRDATLMERLEADILGRLGVDDPYREASGAPTPHLDRTDGRH